MKPAFISKADIAIIANDDMIDDRNSKEVTCLHKSVG
jgi:hypothetical protein